MIDLSYQTSLHTKIELLLPEYRSTNDRERIGKMLRSITEGQAKHLYRLCMEKKRIELKQFIVAHI